VVNKGKATRRRQGLKPGEYRKRGPVYVERLRSSEEQARYVEDNLFTTDTYIVMTHRDDGHWTHTVELHGEMMRLPGKVVERIINQRKAIEKEQRSDRAKDNHAARSAQARIDQEEEEAERLSDLEGL
jgi:hypothetical protein